VSDVNANIGVNIDSSQALAELKNLQRKISEFNLAIAKSNEAAALAQKSLQRNLINSINSIGAFSAELRTVNTTAESFTKALEGNKLSMREYFRYAAASTKTFGRSFTSEIDTLNKVAVERVKTLQTQYIKMGRDASGAMKAIAVRPLVLDMESLATQTQIAAQKQALFNQLMRQGSTQLLNFGKNTQWAGRQLMVGFTLPLAAFGAAASKAFKDLETEVIKFRKVYGDLGTDSKETEKALEGIRALADGYTKYGVEVAKTVGVASAAAAAGFKNADLIAQTDAATKLAILGQIDQQQALETTISLQNAFKISSTELATTIDFLNAVENQTVTSLDDITTAIPKVAPVIQSLGGDVKDLAFFLTAMKEGGINASEGANALKSGLASLINPTNKATAMLGSMGINIDAIVTKNAGNLKKTVVEFAQELDKLDPLARARAIETMFGKFQFARISTLLNNVTQQGNQASRVLDLASQSASNLASLTEKELGTTAESALMKFQGAVAKLKASLAPVGEVFMKSLAPILEFISKVLDKFNGLSEGTKKFIAITVGVIGGLGPILLMTFGLLANGVANIIKLFMTLRNGYQRLTGQSQNLGEQTQYLTNEQLEAAAAAHSLEQSHARLTQQFSAEASAVNQLRNAYDQALMAATRFASVNPGLMKAPKNFADGGVVVSGPGGPKDDRVPANLSNGEVVLSVDTVKKNRGIISALLSGGKVKVPGFARNPGSTVGDSPINLVDGLIPMFGEYQGRMQDPRQNMRQQAGVTSLGNVLAPLTVRVAEARGVSVSQKSILSGKLDQISDELAQVTQTFVDEVNTNYTETYKHIADTNERFRLSWNNAGKKVENEVNKIASDADRGVVRKTFGLDEDIYSTIPTAPRKEGETTPTRARQGAFKRDKYGIRSYTGLRPAFKSMYERITGESGADLQYGHVGSPRMENISTLQADPLASSGVRSAARVMSGEAQAVKQRVQILNAFDISDEIAAISGRNVQSLKIAWSKLSTEAKERLIELSGNAEKFTAELMKEAEKAGIAGFEVGDSAVKGVARGARTRSPSEATRQTAREIIEGLRMELAAGQKVVAAAGTKVGQTAIAAVDIGIANGTKKRRVSQRPQGPAPIGPEVPAGAIMLPIVAADIISGNSGKGKDVDKKGLVSGRGMMTSMGLMAGSMALSTLPDFTGKAMLQSSMNLASMGAMFGPWGAAAGAAVGLVTSGLSALIEKEKEQKAIAAATFQTSAEEVSFFGGKVLDASLKLQNVGYYIKGITSSFGGLNAEMQRFVDMVNKLDPENPLRLFVEGLKKENLSGLVDKVQSRITSEIAVGTFQAEEAQKMTMAYLAAAGRANEFTKVWEKISLSVVSSTEATRASFKGLYADAVPDILTGSLLNSLGMEGARGRVFKYSDGQLAEYSQLKQSLKDVADQMLNFVGVMTNGSLNLDDFNSRLAGLKGTALDSSLGIDALAVAIKNTKDADAIAAFEQIRMSLQGISGEAATASNAIILMTINSMGAMNDLKAWASKNARTVPGINPMDLGQTSSANPDVFLAWWEKIGKARYKTYAAEQKKIMDELYGTNGTSTTGQSELSAASRAYLKVLDKEISGLENKLKIQEKVNDETQRSIDLASKQQDLDQKIAEAKMTGNYIQAAILEQQKISNVASFNQETTTSNLRDEVDSLKLRYAQIEKGGKLTPQEKAKIGIRRASGGIVNNYDAGGNVSGPGTATSDSIPAMLSDGEYVVKASAVDKYGVPLLHALNSEKLATGGGVGRASRATGIDSSGHPLGWMWSNAGKPSVAKPSMKKKPSLYQEMKAINDQWYAENGDLADKEPTVNPADPNGFYYQDANGNYNPLRKRSKEEMLQQYKSSRAALLERLKILKQADGGLVPGFFKGGKVILEQIMKLFSKKIIPSVSNFASKTMPDFKEIIGTTGRYLASKVVNTAPILNPLNIRPQNIFKNVDSNLPTDVIDESVLFPGTTNKLMQKGVLPKTTSVRVYERVISDLNRMSSEAQASTGVPRLSESMTKLPDIPFIEGKLGSVNALTKEQLYMSKQGTPWPQLLPEIKKTFKTQKTDVFSKEQLMSPDFDEDVDVPLRTITSRFNPEYLKNYYGTLKRAVESYNKVKPTSDNPPFATPWGDVLVPALKNVPNGQNQSTRIVESFIHELGHRDEVFVGKKFPDILPYVANPKSQNASREVYADSFQRKSIDLLKSNDPKYSGFSGKFNSSQGYGVNPLPDNVFPGSLEFDEALQANIEKAIKRALATGFRRRQVNADWYETYAAGMRLDPKIKDKPIVDMYDALKDEFAKRGIYNENQPDYLPLLRQMAIDKGIQLTGVTYKKAKGGYINPTNAPIQKFGTGGMPNPLSIGMSKVGDFFKGVQNKVVNPLVNNPVTRFAKNEMLGIDDLQTAYRKGMAGDDLGAMRAGAVSATELLLNLAGGPVTKKLFKFIGKPFLKLGSKLATPFKFMGSQLAKPFNFGKKIVTLPARRRAEEAAEIEATRIRMEEDKKNGVLSLWDSLDTSEMNLADNPWAGALTPPTPSLLSKIINPVKAAGKFLARPITTPAYYAKTLFGDAKEAFATGNTDRYKWTGNWDSFGRGILGEEAVTKLFGSIGKRFNPKAKIFDTYYNTSTWQTEGMENVLTPFQNLMVDRIKTNGNIYGLAKYRNILPNIKRKYVDPLIEQSLRSMSAAGAAPKSGVDSFLNKTASYKDLSIGIAKSLMYQAKSKAKNTFNSLLGNFSEAKSKVLFDNSPLDFRTLALTGKKELSLHAPEVAKSIIGNAQYFIKRVSPQGMGNELFGSEWMNKIGLPAPVNRPITNPPYIAGRSGATFYENTETIASESFLEKGWKTVSSFLEEANSPLTFDPNDITAIIKQGIIPNKLALDVAQSVIGHSDLHPGNQLIDTVTGKLGMLDFESILGSGGSALTNTVTKLKDNKVSSQLIKDSMLKQLGKIEAIPESSIYQMMVKSGMPDPDRALKLYMERLSVTKNTIEEIIANKLWFANGGKVNVPKFHNWNGPLPGPYGQEFGALVKSGTEGVYQEDYMNRLRRDANVNSSTSNSNAVYNNNIVINGTDLDKRELADEVMSRLNRLQQVNNKSNKVVF